jgi:predicted MPP superfamily phosphohydrolase
MILILVLIATEILATEVLRQHFYKTSRSRYYITTLIHVILSIWFWLLYFKVRTFDSFYDDPGNIWMQMALHGTFFAITFPRLILIIFHFTGKLIRRKTGGHLRWLTNTGLVVMALIFVILTISALRGRFNFKTENITIAVKDLNKDLEGLKIVQLSDMHLATFNHHKAMLQKVIERVNSYKPDLILNTGDFVTFGWREFDGNDTILAKAHSKYGNFAVLGNHDFGIYHPDYTEADRKNSVLILENLVRKSGYQLLNDEYSKIKIGNASVALIGVHTIGRHSEITYGDLQKTISGLDSVDFKILLSHDPNHWEMAVTAKTDIDLTLSGHTHGMQMGIITEKLRWSPARFLYPHWNGLFTEGEQFQYVNRGLGVLGIPFRIWMPPEITVITLKRKRAAF